VDDEGRPIVMMKAVLKSSMHRIRRRSCMCLKQMR